jgi:predicted ATPase/class 3 adenylate cyclase
MTETLTFLFTDLEGSTRLWQEYPEAMKIILSRHDELLRTAIEGNNGRVVKTTGDGFHAAFTSAQDGLNVCIQAQQNLIKESWEETGSLRVRMGLHVGEAQERGDDYYGTVVNRAARLMSAANGGQVLLSSAVAGMVVDHLPEGVSLRDLGEHRLKDLQRAEHIFQLVYPDLPADFPSIASLNRLPNNLPSQPSVFIGRHSELNEINELLVAEKVRMLTLLGPGGTGKTRLALQSGAELFDRFDDGTYFIDLAPIRDPDSVLAIIARTIGMNESSNGSMLNELKDQLQGKTMLLLLDNFEQVTSAAVQVADLLQYCPRLKLLTTSREALHVRGEHLYPVPPLGLPKQDLRRTTAEDLIQYEAVQLFLERALAVKPNFELSEENARVIAELCLRLDGLPLAIELAAARVRLFSPQALLDRLGSRLKVLKGGARDLPERQQTLRDTIDWSYELLSDQEKILFGVMSVFSGGTFEAVEAVIEDLENLIEQDIDVVEMLVSLVDKSLIRMSEDSKGEPRLQMLETIREYAAERLNDNPEFDAAVCRAHASYYADFAERLWGFMMGARREEALKEMETEVDNLQIAWRYWVEGGELEQLQKMVNGLWLLYDGRGWYQAMVELTTDLLELLATIPSSQEQIEQEIMLHTSLARALMALKGFTGEVEQAYVRALELSEGLGEIPQLFPILRGLASFYMFRTEFDKAAQMGQKILDLAERSDDDYLRVHGYLVLGTNTGFAIGYQKGLELLDKGIELFERDPKAMRPFQIGNNPGIVCYTTSAFISFWLGFPDQAVERANRAIELVTELNHPLSMAYALFHTGSLHLWRGEIGLVKERAEALLAVAEEHNFQIWESLATIQIGLVQVMSGEQDAGLANVEQGFAKYQGHINPPVFYPAIIHMRAAAFAQAGQLSEALKLIDDILNATDDERIMQEFPVLLLLKGDLLVFEAKENIEKAVGIFHRILNFAEQIGGKYLALQAATRLCRIEMVAGNAVESGRVLAEIYYSFTEGFETLDLRAAKEVLDQWRGKNMDLIE